MCGIAGYVTQEPPAGIDSMAALQRMAATLAHRGPDDSGVWLSDDRTVGLAHRRLSIIDLSPLGRNPMPWDGGRLMITFNGEIYNFLELRQELEAAGHRFRSQSDTEVILAAYDEWGLDAVHHLAGMFAFALWDGARRRLWLVRDRLGKKPVYYCNRYSDRGRTLTFASELKALVTEAGLPHTIDRAALRMYFRYGYVPAPLSIFASVRKLEPGHALLVENGRTSVERYWDPVAYATPNGAVSDQDATGELERRLSLAVRQRMIADVPLGAFLSGGIDSSLVVALMQEQSSRPVQTFTVRFDNPHYNEADQAAAVARHLGTDHFEQACHEHELLEIVDRLPGMFDEPFADSSAIPTFLVSRVAREHVTVALSGDGGDELFYGYPRYRHHERLLPVLHLPAPVLDLAAATARRFVTRRLRRVADVLTDRDTDAYSRFVGWFTPAEIVSLTGGPPSLPPLYDDVARRARNVTPALRPLLLDLVSFLPDDILAKVDRASMAASLEVRAPLLDHRVVEFALGLPMRMKRRGLTRKWLLRELLYKRVPRELVDRPKMGFGVPLGDWLQGPLRSRMDDYCRGDDLTSLGLDPEPIRTMWREFSHGRRHRPDLLWQAFSLIAWARKFAMREEAA